MPTRNLSDEEREAIGSWCHEEMCADGLIVPQVLTNERIVRVLIVLDEDAKVRECLVLTNLCQADELYQRLRKIWGGANVAMASRRIDDIPTNLHERSEIATEILQ